jgi:hypothetical protein
MDIKENKNSIDTIAFTKQISFSEKSNKELCGIGLPQEEYDTGLKYMHGIQVERNLATAFK